MLPLLWKVKWRAWPLSSAKQTLSRVVCPGWSRQKQKLSGLSTETFTDKHTLLSFPRCFDWAVSPPLFIFHVGVAPLAAWLPLSVGRTRKRTKALRVMCFQGFSCVSVGSMCVCETHVWISLLPCSELMSLLKQQSNIAVLQMMIRRGQFLCG